ncbi:DUF768 domain-containing protein [Mesorhizobium sp. WSM4306]|nr:DUF768 domain-containing protein [Mesorhizobium sp. WSM4306]
MSERAARFLHLWMEAQGLFDGVCFSQAAINELARHLLSEAEAEGISEAEITQAFWRLRATLRRRHQLSPTKH